MRFITTLFAIANIFIARLGAPLYMAVFVWFIKWDTFCSPGQGTDDLYETERGYLPRWLVWAMTVDCPYPGGLYEPTVKARLLARGRMWCSYVWSGLRNPMGISMWFAQKALGPIPDYSSTTPVAGWEQVGTAWHYERIEDGMWKRVWWVGRVKFERGWEVYRRMDSVSYCRIPHFTLRLDRAHR
jgi:hypothetical protein